MESQPLEQAVEQIDRRLARVEQFLPTLATKAELSEAIAPLATKAELAEAIAPLATKAELAEAVAPLATKAELAEAVAPLATKAELAEAVAPLATKAELAEAIAPLATKAELAEAIAAEGERTRRYFDLVAERLESQIRWLAEGHVALRESMNEQFREVRGDIARLDQRVMRLEADRRV